MHTNLFPRLFFSALFLFLSFQNVYASSSLWAIQNMGEDLAQQLKNRTQHINLDMERAGIIVTTPVNLDNLAQSSPLARLMAEDLSTWLVRHGYLVQEIRRSDAIMMAPGRGEISLTRDTSSLYKTAPPASLLITSTYTVLPDQVVFHFRVLKAASNEVLAMSPLRVPLDQRNYTLLTTNEKRGRTSLFAPSVKTSLPLQ